MRNVSQRLARLEAFLNARTAPPQEGESGITRALLNDPKLRERAIAVLESPDPLLSIEKWANEDAEFADFILDYRREKRRK